MRHLATLAFGFFALGCSSNPPPSNAETSGGEDSTGTVETASDPETDPPSETTSGSDRPAPVGGDNEHEITLNDCKALGEKYRDNTIADEVKKLDPKLSDAQREKGREAISNGAAKLGSKWIVSCESGLVGKYTQEDSLKCAMSSKTVADFDACLNGPPAGAPAK